MNAYANSMDDAIGIRKKTKKVRKSQMEEHGNRVEKREMEDYQDIDRSRGGHE